MASASAYAVLGIAHPGTLPGPELMALLAEWSFVPIFTAIVFMLLLFPSGTLPSPRWRSFAGLALLATALALAGFVVHPRLIALPAPGGESLTVANPLGIESLGAVLSTVVIGTLDSLGAVDLVLLAVASVSLVVRYRSASRDVRKQIKWILVAAVGATVGQLVALLGIAVTGTESNPVTTVAFVVIPIIMLFGIPAIIAVAILKHGLYQIDVIINRAIRYGLLSAVLTAIYVLHRGGDRDAGRLRRAARCSMAAAALAIALLFQPLRRRAQRAGEPGRLRAAGHAVPGARRLRPGHGRPAGRRPGTRPDGVGPGRRHRRGPGGGLDPGRAAATAAGDLAAADPPRPPPLSLTERRQAAGARRDDRAIAVRHTDELLGAITIVQAEE